MSIPCSALACNTCNYRAVRCPVGNWCYQLPSGKTTDAWISSGWCSACDTLTIIEKFPSIDGITSKLESTIAESEQYSSTFFARLRTLLSSSRRYWRARATEEAGRLQTELDHAREFLDVRRSPSKCLSCGGELFQPLDLKDINQTYEIPHRGCSAPLRVVKALWPFPDSIKVTVMDVEANVVSTHFRTVEY